jgi:hypothetical protein
MPYTPPSQRVPASSRDVSFSISSVGPHLPRSSSYLPRHRRTPSILQRTEPATFAKTDQDARDALEPPLMPKPPRVPQPPLMRQYDDVPEEVTPPKESLMSIFRKVHGNEEPNTSTKSPDPSDHQADRNVQPTSVRPEPTTDTSRTQEQSPSTLVSDEKANPGEGQTIVNEGGAILGATQEKVEDVSDWMNSSADSKLVEVDDGVPSTKEHCPGDSSPPLDDKMTDVHKVQDTLQISGSHGEIVADVHNFEFAKDPEPDAQADGIVPSTPEKAGIGRSYGSPNSIDRIAPPVPLSPFATTPRKRIGGPHNARPIDDYENPFNSLTNVSTADLKPPELSSPKRNGISKTYNKDVGLSDDDLEWDTTRPTCSLPLVCYRSGSRGCERGKVEAAMQSRFASEDAFQKTTAENSKLVKTDKDFFYALRIVYSREMCNFWRRNLSLKSLHGIRLLLVSETNAMPRTSTICFYLNTHCPQYKPNRRPEPVEIDDFTLQAVFYAYQHSSEIETEHDWIDWVFRLRKPDHRYALEFVEGWNTTRIAIAGSLPILFSTLVGVIWTILGGDVQTTFTVAGFILTCGTCEWPFEVLPTKADLLPSSNACNTRNYKWNRGIRKKKRLI